MPSIPKCKCSLNGLETIQGNLNGLENTHTYKLYSSLNGLENMHMYRLYSSLNGLENTHVQAIQPHRLRKPTPIQKATPPKYMYKAASMA